MSATPVPGSTGFGRLCTTQDENQWVQWGAHCLMVHILTFNRSHWMPPLGKRLHHIAPAAAIVDKIVAKHKTLTKKTFLAC